MLSGADRVYRRLIETMSEGRLAGGVAHDFNNMPQVINSYAEIILMKLEPSGPLRAHVRQIANAGQRSADLNDTVAGMLKMLGRLIGEDIDLLWKPVANPWLVKIDPSQIDQILANLTVNARDAIAGVDRITIETGKVEFDQAYCEGHVGFVPGHYDTLAVSDDGCGMDKETQARLFEPFFTTKPLGHGTGLGLAAMYGIVKQNSDFINMYSEPAKGTTFKIYLPRQESDKQVTEAPREDAGVPTGTETVVLVEDEVALLELGRTLLEQLGCTANAIGHHGILDKGIHFLKKPFSLDRRCLPRNSVRRCPHEYRTRKGGSRRALRCTCGSGMAPASPRGPAVERWRGATGVPGAVVKRPTVLDILAAGLSH